ncbi:hypothetical protein [Acidicapsa ligni]|uniref:hypothetical protein n=1 Tax=Acidicapsa ligni TaxID=542300 RepID=UPI0021E0C488|nr:hypothetical protein [Acidicapsa ligni]
MTEPKSIEWLLLNFIREAILAAQERDVYKNAAQNTEVTRVLVRTAFSSPEYDLKRRQCNALFQEVWEAVQKSDLSKVAEELGGLSGILGLTVSGSQE